jgi:hypothetical protein
LQNLPTRPRRSTPGLALVAVLTAAPAACGGTEAPGGAPKPAISKGAAPAQGRPANVVGTFAVKLPAVTLQPGQELEPCYIFPLALAGPSHIVGGAKVVTARGMHHGDLTTRKQTTEGTDTGKGYRECPPGDSFVGLGLDVASGGAVLFGSTTQIQGEEWWSFPQGMGYRIKDGFEIVARMHYLNVTDKPLTIEPAYEWYTIDEAKVTQEIAPFAWVYKEFTVPPKSELTVTGECRFPAGMRVVSVLPHMHKLGRRFQAKFLGGPLDGTAFLDAKGYDPEKTTISQYEPAIDLGQGEGATFSCAWNNTLDKPVTWGIGDNEMCVLFGYAYPPNAAYSLLASKSGCVYSKAQ